MEDIWALTILGRVMVYCNYAFSNHILEKGDLHIFTRAFAI